MNRPDDQVLQDIKEKIAFTLDKAYMPRLSNYGVLCFDEKYNKEGAICYENNIRAVKVDRWVFDKEEKPGENFKNVLSTFSDGDHTIALVVKRTPSRTEMYFVVKNEGGGRNEDSRENVILLKNSITANFQGSECEIIKDPDQLEKIFSFSDQFEINGRKEDKIQSIALLTNTPSEYSKDYIGQGLDKVLNGIVPQTDQESYTIVFLAESLALSNIRDIISGYEEMATAIYPFLQYTYRQGENRTDTHGEMESISDTESISNSIFKTHSINIGLNGGISQSRSNTVNESMSRTRDSLGNLLVPVLGPVLGAIGGMVAGPLGATVGNLLVGVLFSGSKTRERGSSQTNEVGNQFGLSAGYGYSWGKSETVGSSKTQTKGRNNSISTGISEDTTYTYKSYQVADLLKKIEQTIDRINKSQATGLWKYSAYVLARDSKTTKNVANFLKGITQGKESFNEPAYVQEWSGEDGNRVTAFGEIKKYISHFTHPIFIAADSNDENAMILTATSYVATDELSHVIAFPQKPLKGLPVLEGIEFGREPHSLVFTNSDLEIGSEYYKYQINIVQRISISKEELTSHTFITGSTGSGKSNTIYCLLKRLVDQDVKFLVVEPAKGEYKEVIGKRSDVSVYGTNPLVKEMELLRLNPFRFPKHTHILEHLDRLIEIFNVCWPMYAAMPAILKDSVERAYVCSGWDLEKSENKYDSELFPTFVDVVEQIKEVLVESDYSEDNKGDYTGALVTRLKSLTNGINGLIFVSDDIKDEDLFDKNVIVDLSRVGSSETKSLIMGLLVLKLQEYRMEQRVMGAIINDSLKHVTVLEEAHNLLKKTSTEQVSEGSNLIGKSVEMLANSIAEMRTYGEGFIIADQSPGLLDMSVIRNTNTKIILRLPDYSDRVLVGKSVGLTDAQIDKLSNLEKGVAVIRQSDWLEPVLCKVDKYEDKESNIPGIKKTSNYSVSIKRDYNTINISESLLDYIMSKELYRKGDRVDIQKLKSRILKSNLNTSVKCDFMKYVTAATENELDVLRCLAYDLLQTEKAMKDASKYDNLDEWIHIMVEHLSPSISRYSREQIDLMVALLLYRQSLRDTRYDDLLSAFVERYKNKGGVY